MQLITKPKRKCDRTILFAHHDRQWWSVHKSSLLLAITINVCKAEATILPVCPPTTTVSCQAYGEFSTSSPPCSRVLHRLIRPMNWICYRIAASCCTDEAWWRQWALSVTIITQSVAVIHVQSVPYNHNTVYSLVSRFNQLTGLCNVWTNSILEPKLIYGRLDHDLYIPRIDAVQSHQPHHFSRFPFGN